MINFLLIVLSSPCFAVWLMDWWFKSQNSYLIRSGAYPNSIHAIQSTHYFEICIVRSITQLLIEIPEWIGVTNQITVIDQRCRAIDFVADSTSRDLTIAFARPIVPGQILSVAIHGIRSSAHSSQTWVYNLYGKEWKGGFRLLGIARIAMYCYSILQFGGLAFCLDWAGEFWACTVSH